MDIFSLGIIALFMIMAIAFMIDKDKLEDKLELSKYEHIRYKGLYDRDSAVLVALDKENQELKKKLNDINRIVNPQTTESGKSI